MPTITSGSNATFTVPSGSVIDIQCPGGWVQLEYPTGTKVFEGNPAGQTFGPYTGATAKITSVKGDVYYEVDPFAYQDTLSLPSKVTQNNANRLNYRKAFAKVLAGQRARLLVFGDSTCVGAGAGTNSGGTFGGVGARAKNFCSKLATSLTAMGIPAWNEAIFGDQNVSTLGETYAAYDPRVSLGAWTPTNIESLGANCWTVSAISTFAFTPAMTFDRIDVYTVQNPGTGSVTVNVDGGATLATINEAGSAAIIKTTVSCTRGTHTINIASTSTTTVYLLGVVPWDSTLGGLDIIQAGHSGGGVNSFAKTSSPWSASAATNLSAIAPDLAIIQATINEANGGVTPATYASNLAILEGALATAGCETMLMSGIPSNNVATTNGALAAIVAQVTARAASQSRVYADLGARCGSYATMNAAGWMFDSAHGNSLLYADEGRWLAQILAAEMQ